MVKQRSSVAFALAVGVGVSLVLLAVGIVWAIADSQQELSAEASTLASAVLGGAIGALATYLGGGGNDDPPPAEPPAEPPSWAGDDQLEP